MKWIDVNERVPEQGQKVLVKGLWCGEINGSNEDRSVGFVEWESIESSMIIGGDAYASWMLDISDWADLSELL